MKLSEARRNEVRLPPLVERTTPAVLRLALDRHPDKLAVRDRNHALTYRALADRALQWAGGVETLGVGRQEAVLLMLDNHVDFVALWLGLSLTARVEVPVNTGYRGPILGHVIRNSGAKVMIVEAAYLERLGEVADALGGVETIVVRGPAPVASLPDHIRVTSLDALPLAPAAMADVKPWDIIAIMYTSGTSGPSKGALIPHAQAYGYASPAVTAATVEDDVSLTVLPLFHVTAQWGSVYNAFIAGATALVLPRFSATAFWDDVRRFGCTKSAVLGTVAQFLFNQPPKPDDRDQPLRKMGMSPVIPEIEAFKARFGIEAVLTGYGSTEVSTVACARPGEAVPGEAGFIRSDYEVRLVDENDMDVAPGEAGELLVRAVEPWVTMAGYVNMPEATAKAWRNLWFHTGDLMRLAEDGQLIFCDRTNDAIRRKGENISSFEIEREADRHPAVLESAAIKAPSDHVDDEVKLCVAPREGMTVAFDDLLAHLRSRLPAFMVPRYIEIVDALPKTPTQKVLKAQLRKDSLNPRTWDSAAGDFLK
jgi:crotonobetaine/carnitine-CoA ligase